jgi:hypothetical protein
MVVVAVHLRGSAETTPNSASPYHANSRGRKYADSATDALRIGPYPVRRPKLRF